MLAPDVYCLYNFSGNISNALENNPDITFTSARNGLWTESWKKNQIILNSTLLSDGSLKCLESVSSVSTPHCVPLITAFNNKERINLKY